MNNSTQAQKGFKTFLLTLSISLIVFSAIYYLITNVSPSDDSLPAEVSSDVETPKQVSNNSDQDSEDGTTFGQLAMQPMDIPGRAVLAGASTAPSQTTQSTTSVPTTGLVGVTFGLFASLTMFLSALYVIARDPRRLAMLSFEKETIRRL